MNDDDFDAWGRILLCIVILGMFLYFGTGCAAVPTLSITDAEVDAKLAALSGPPKDPTAVVYNATGDVYEMRPDVYKRAVRDGVVKDIQDEKIATMNEYLSKHPPADFKVKAKWFSWGMLAGVIATLAAGFALSK